MPDSAVIEEFDEALELFQPPAWMRDALCHEYPDVEFFPERGHATCAPAKLVCQRCLVQRECLAFALRERIVHGVWGGTSERERRVLRAMRAA